MKAVLKYVTALIFACAVCLCSAAAQDITVGGIGSDGALTGIADYKALSVDFYLSGDFKKSLLTGETVSVEDSLGNEVELGHAAYDYELGALSVFPKNSLRPSGKYTLKILKEVFGGSDDFTYDFTTDFDTVAVKYFEITIGADDDECIARVDFDCKPGAQADVAVVGAVVRGGKVESITVERITVNETTAAQPLIVPADGVQRYDTVRFYVWNYDGDMIRTLAEASCVCAAEFE